MKEINLYEAVKMFREYSKNNIPTKLVFLSYNEKKNQSDGLKIVEKAFFRPTLKPDQSDKSSVLIGYIDDEAIGNKNRFLYLPLLISINGIKVVPV